MSITEEEAIDRAITASLHEEKESVRLVLKVRPNQDDKDAPQVPVNPEPVAPSKEPPWYGAKLKTTIKGGWITRKWV